MGQDTLTFALLTDGSSDNVLEYVLKWLLEQHMVSSTIIPRWVDLRVIARPPKTLAARISKAIELQPCDILFVHRDAERMTYIERKAEIKAALNEVESSLEGLPAVCVVPVRMQEAWFLFNEDAIREAAENPSGKIQLALPLLKEVADLPDPKDRLYGLLETASELSGRRLKNFRPHVKAHRLAEIIGDFTPLRKLEAFQNLERDIIDIIEQNHWN